MNNPNREKKTSRSIMAVAMLLFLVALEALYFRKPIFYGTALGETGDGLLINMTLEHWKDVFDGKLPVCDMRAFYPQKGTLGYSDLLLGMAIPYSFFRSFGVSVFAAQNYALILVHFLGVLCLFAGLRYLNLRYPACLAAVMLCFYSCSFSALTYHLQFFALSYAAMGFLIMVCYYINMEKQGKRIIYGLLFFSSLGLCFLSSFYTGYLMSLYLILSSLITFFFSLKKGRIPKMRGLVREYWTELLLYAFFNLIWLIPFCLVYLPVKKSVGGADSSEILFFSPRPYELFRNFSYAPVEKILSDKLPFAIDQRFSMYASNRLLETSYGWPVLMYIVYLICFIGLFIQKDKKDFRSRALIAAMLSVPILLSLFCRYGDFCPWVYIGRVIPGGNAMRALGRSMSVFLLPVSVFTAIGIKAILGKNVKALYIAYVVIILWLGISAISRRFDDRDVTYYQKWMDGVNEVPDGLKAVIVLQDDKDGVYTAKWQMMAWLLADKLDVYTLNGYSGNVPVGWDLFNRGQTDYLRNIESWREKNGIPTDGLYYYSVPSGLWIPYEYGELFQMYLWGTESE